MQLPELPENPDPEQIADWIIATDKVFRIIFETRGNLHYYMSWIVDIRRAQEHLRLAAKDDRPSPIEQILLIYRGRNLYLCPPTYLKIPERFIASATLTQDEADAELEQPCP